MEFTKEDLVSSVFNRDAPRGVMLDIPSGQRALAYEKDGYGAQSVGLRVLVPMQQLSPGLQSKIEALAPACKDLRKLVIRDDAADLVGYVQFTEKSP